MAKKQSNKVKCIECRHSELTQKGNNPVIAKCPFLLYRQVANSIRECERFAKALSGKTIIKT